MKTTEINVWYSIQLSFSMVQPLQWLPKDSVFNEENLVHEYLLPRGNDLQFSRRSREILQKRYFLFWTLRHLSAISNQNMVHSLPHHHPHLLNISIFKFFCTFFGVHKQLFTVHYMDFYGIHQGSKFYSLFNEQ